MSDKPKSTHGGKRPGAGMKPKPGRKVNKHRAFYLFTDQHVTPGEVREAVDEYLTKKKYNQCQSEQ